MPKPDPATRPGRPGLLRLVGLPFLLIGLLGLAALLRELVLVAQTHRWQPTQATVLAVELQTEAASKRGGTVQRVLPHYTYTVNGRHYEGRAVREADPPTGMDGGSYHREWAERLNAAREAERTVDAWYAPDEPHRSVLYRGLRLSTVGVYTFVLLVFGGAGIMLLWAPGRQAPSGQAARRPPAAAEAASSAVGVQVVESADAVEVRFVRPPDGTWLLAVGSGLCFAAAAWAPRATQVAGPLVVGLALLGVAAWRWNRIVAWRVAGGTLHLQRRVGGRSLPLADLAGLEEQRSEEQGGPVRVTLVATLPNGRRQPLIDGVRPGDVALLRRALQRRPGR